MTPHPPTDAPASGPAHAHARTRPSIEKQSFSSCGGPASDTCSARIVDGGSLTRLVARCRAVLPPLSLELVPVESVPLIKRGILGVAPGEPTRSPSTRCAAAVAGETFIFADAELSTKPPLMREQSLTTWPTR
jgi:hypothetical protein